MGVLESNAGDRYHFVYTARLLVSMLYPHNELQCVVMEGVAQPNDVTDEDAYVGVDLTEYYGGTNTSEAERIAIVQVKYSSRHPSREWTLARLLKPTARNDPKTSVLGKLATAFSALHESVTCEVSVEMITNRPLAKKDRASFDRVKAHYRKGIPLDDKDQQWLDRVQSASGLADQRLARFILAWRIEGFGSPLLTESEGELFLGLEPVVSDSIHVENLISFVQEHAVPNRTQEIRKQNVLAQLRLNEDDFQPAPNNLQRPEALFATQDVVRLAETILQAGTPIIIAHGLAGKGKTSTLLALAESHAEEFDIVIYDCFGDGSFLTAGRERFPFAKFFTQVINDLDAALATGVFATAKLSYDVIHRQFRKALSAAADATTARGKRLVIAIDAIDNAVAAANQLPLKANESFVPMLSRIEWPEGVVLVSTARTENVPELGFDNVSKVELVGFTEDETEYYAREMIEDISEDDAKRLHECSAGTPRVQSRILEQLRTNPAENIPDFITTHARKNAFEYYEEETPDRLKNPRRRNALAIVFAATSPIDLAQWARLAEEPLTFVDSIRDSLAFGLRISEGMVEWRDQEFWDFIHEHLEAEIAVAHRRLADYCREHPQDPYSRANFVRHHFESQQYDEIVNHLLARLDRQQRDRSDLGNADDLGYGIVSAQVRERRVDTLRLLWMAAEESQSRSLFVEALTKVPEVAVSEGYGPSVFSALRDAEQSALVARAYLKFAAATPDFDLAGELIERADAILRQEARDGYEGGFQEEDVLAIATADVHRHSLIVALDRLRWWTPQSAVAGIYFDVISAHAAEDNVAAVLDMIPAIEDGECRVHAALGALALGSAISDESAAAMGDIVGAGVREGGHRIEVSRVLDVAESLLRANRRQEALGVLPLCDVLPPRFRYEPVQPFLRFAALREMLSGEPFEPAKLKEPDETRGGSDLERMRSLFGRLLPAFRLRLRAMAGEEITDLQAEVERIVEGYGEKTYRREPPRFDVRIAAEQVYSALTFLPERHPAVVSRVGSMVERELPNPASRQYASLVATLADDRRYRRKSEELFRHAIASERPPHARAVEAVDSLLGAYASASVVSETLARELFEAARELCMGIDATVDSRASALLVAARATIESGVTLSVEELEPLRCLAEHAAEMSVEGSFGLMDRTLPLLARVDPGAGADVAKRWDERAYLDLSVSLPAFAKGLAERAELPRSLLGSIAWYVADARAVTNFFVDLGFRSLDGTLESLLEYWEKHVEQMPGTERFDGATSLVEFARDRGLHENATVIRLRQALETASELGLRKVREQSLPFHGDPHEDVDEILDLIKSNPDEALKALETVGMSRISYSSRPEVVVAAFAQALSSEDCGRLASILESWVADAPFHALEVVKLFEILSREGPTGGLATLRDTMTRIIAIPRVVALLRYDHQDRPVERLQFLFEEDEERLFDALADTIARNLSELGAETLFFWTGHLAKLIGGTGAREFYRTVAPGTLEGLDRRIEPLRASGETSRSALARAIADTFAHPRVEVRFQAVYSAVDLVLGDSGFITPLIAQMQSTKHSRWMTLREWALVFFHHISLVRPNLLVPHTIAFADIATDRAVPHAKHRYYAREIVLAIERADPSAVSEDIRAEVAAVQLPRSFRKSGGDVRYDREDFSYWYEKPFHIDTMDTLPYWYRPLGTVFDMSAAEIGDRALEWIVKKWGITQELCNTEFDHDPHEYEWGMTSNRQGSQAGVETLHLYAERHAMYAAAGDLIDSCPVVRERGEPNAWSQWVLRDVREVDPALPSRLLEPAPLDPENYGVFGRDLETWKKIRPVQDYLRYVRGEGNSIALLTHSEGMFGSYSFDVSVRSVFVNRETAGAFIRSLVLTDQFYAHAQRLYDYMAVIPDIEDRILRERDDERDEQGDEELFRLRPTIAAFDQELPFHPYDPRWKSHRRYPVPSTLVRRFLKLRRPDPLRLDWVDKKGEEVIRVRMWHDMKGDHDANGASGYRMSITATALWNLLKKSGDDIAIIVTLRRQTSYSYLQVGKERDDYDPGTSHAFLASELLTS
jgi:hypothetical protein